MFRCLAVIFGLLSIQVEAQQLQLVHSDDPQNVPLISIRQLAGRKTRIAEDLPNATLAIWGDAKENYLFGEKYRELLGSATFASFDARVHHLNYGFFYAVSNENIRFIPLPTGHHCHGRWFQYGKIRGVFLFYDGQYRFGSYCLENKAIAFLDQHGHSIVSHSEAGPAPHQHSDFYQICIGKKKQSVTSSADILSPIPPNPINHFPSLPVDSNCSNGINCYSQNSLILAQGKKNSNSFVIEKRDSNNFGCGNGEFSAVFDCTVRNGQKQSNELIPPPIAYPPVARASSNQDSPSYAQVPPYPLGSGKDAYDLPPPFDPRYESQQSNAGKKRIQMIRFLIFLGIPTILLSIL